MKIYRGVSRIPKREKVIKQFQIDTMLELPNYLHKAFRDYFDHLYFVPLISRCTFYLTDAGNYAIEGLDELELDSIYTIAYRNYRSAIFNSNRHESFNGICYATKQEFIEDCKDKSYAQHFMDKKGYKRYCSLIKMKGALST